MEGVVAQIYIADYQGKPIQQLASVEAVANRGLEGDRYFNRTGYWCGVDECQVTLIEGEFLVRIFEDTNLSVKLGEHRRNIVTWGIRLHQLLGRQFSIGRAIFAYDRPRPPCIHLQAQSNQPGLAKALMGQRGGIGARVLKSGLIQVNDPIAVLTEELESFGQPTG